MAVDKKRKDVLVQSRDRQDRINKTENNNCSRCEIYYSELTASQEQLRLSENIFMIVELLSGLTIGDLSALQHIFDLALNSIGKVLSISNGTISILDRETHELVVRSAIGVNKQYEHLNSRFKTQQGLRGHVFTTGEPLIIPDAHADARCRVKIPEIRSRLIVPIKTGDDTVGVISLDSPDVNYFSLRHILWLQVVAVILGRAIERMEQKD